MTGSKESGCVTTDEGLGRQTWKETEGQKQPLSKPARASREGGGTGELSPPPPGPLPPEE